MYRHKVNRHKDRKVFSATADGTHIKNNNSARPMRGGIRL